MQSLTLAAGAKPFCQTVLGKVHATSFCSCVCHRWQVHVLHSPMHLCLCCLASEREPTKWHLWSSRVMSRLDSSLLSDLRFTLPSWPTLVTTPIMSIPACVKQTNTSRQGTIIGRNNTPQTLSKSCFMVSMPYRPIRDSHVMMASYYCSMSMLGHRRTEYAAVLVSASRTITALAVVLRCRTAKHSSKVSCSIGSTVLQYHEHP